MVRWILPPGSRPISEDAGTRSMRGTTSRGSAACSSPVDAMRRMWRSATRSVPTRSRVSRSGPTRSRALATGRTSVIRPEHMRLLTVRHVTIYRYSEPVRFGEHRMMFRPRESHDLRLVSTKLDILPRPSDLRWLHDVFDNSVAIATFDEAASELRFDSTVTLEHIETRAARLRARDRGAHLSLSVFG